MGEQSRKTVEDLFHLFVDDVHRYARLVLRDEELAEKAVHDTFLRAYQSMHRLRGQSVALPWLYTLTRESMVPHATPSRDEQTTDAHRDPSQNETNANTRRILQRDKSSDDMKSLEERLNQLNQEERHAFILHVIEDLSVRETALVLGWSTLRTESILRHALQTLQMDQQVQSEKPMSIRWHTGTQITLPTRDKWLNDRSHTKTFTNATSKGMKQWAQRDRLVLSHQFRPMKSRLVLTPEQKTQMLDTLRKQMERADAEHPDKAGAKRITYLTVSGGILALLAVGASLLAS